MQKFLLYCVFLFSFIVTSNAHAAAPSVERKTYKVGADKEFKFPSEAAKKANDYDIVLIDPGTYIDCAEWDGDHLTLKSAGDQPVHIKNKTCSGKGLWIINGNDTVVENIIFSGAHVMDRNGAGIRHQGGDLHIKNCKFFNNENGILASNNDKAEITIEKTFFEGNGSCKADCAHGIYINRIKKLTVKNSIFYQQMEGHHIKSRAKENIIVENRIDDGAEGTASYAIDLPNGGTSFIIHNTIIKGPLSQNRSTAISIGAEGKLYSNGINTIEGNKFESKVEAPTNFVKNYTNDQVTLKDNVMIGKINIIETSPPKK